MVSGGGEEEVFPLTTTTSEQPVVSERPKSTRSNRAMTWKEARANMGHPEDDFNSPVVPKDAADQPRFLNDQEDVNILKADNDLVLNYLTKEGAPSKWNQNEGRSLQESSPELKTDTEKGVDYVYDTKHGYQVVFFPG